MDIEDTGRRSSTKKKKKINILIADDHPLFRRSVRDVLEIESDFEVVGEASDGVEAVKLTEETHPDVVLMDITMPELDGLGATHQIKANHQEIAVLESEKLGRMLVIDGITMLTEYDEFAYHEMITHVPLLVHPKPARILVIGGGDGGTVREALKHPDVETVHVCELDEEVVNVCRRFLRYRFCTNW